MALSDVAKLIKIRYDNCRHISSKSKNEPDFYRAVIIYGGYGAMCEFPETYDKLIGELKLIFKR